MTKLVNLIPHDINIIVDGVNIVIPRSGIITRVSTTEEVVELLQVNGITVPIKKVSYGDIKYLPDPIKGTKFIVSALVANAAKDRDDLLITYDAIRDDSGSIIGCASLAVV